MVFFVVTEFLLTSVSRGPSFIAELLVLLERGRTHKVTDHPIPTQWLPPTWVLTIACAVLQTCSTTPVAAAQFTGDVRSWPFPQVRDLNLWPLDIRVNALHAEELPFSTSTVTLTLIARAVFLFEHRHADTQRPTDTQTHRRNWSPYSVSRLGYRQREFESYKSIALYRQADNALTHTLR